MTEAGSRFLTFSRDEWAALRAATPLTLREDDLVKLRGINERIDLDEVATVYLPLSRLLNLYVSAWQDLARVSSTFLGTMAPRVPYVIGVAGSVAVGKSTFARILQALLARWPDHPQVDLVTTDGFLHPNAVLLERNLMERKGFPESYDTRRLLRFLRELKSGAEETRAPVYSHVVYDIVEDAEVIVKRPDILILEGLNVLQVSGEKAEFVSDYFDFSIYIDADEADIMEWYVERFFTLRETVFKDPNSFFRHFAALSNDEARATAEMIWTTINGRNLSENILPTRSRASLILRKEADHRVVRGPPAQALSHSRLVRATRRSATERSPMTSTRVQRVAPPQHHQQVVGRAAHRGVALGVLARDDVGAIGVGRDEPLAVDVGAVDVDAAVQRRRALGDVGQEELEELVDAVGRQRRLDAVIAARGAFGVDAVHGDLLGHAPGHEPGVLLCRPRVDGRRRIDVGQRGDELFGAVGGEARTAPRRCPGGSARRTPASPASGP